MIPKHGSQPHIAIADDDSSIRRAMTRLLAAHSIGVKSYASAREFLSSLETEVPGCLILDFQMPEMSGLELLRRLAGSGPQIPTIILTASDEPGIRYCCELAGTMAFLFKPVSGDALLKTMQAVMEGDAVKSLTAPARPDAMKSTAKINPFPIAIPALHLRA